MLGPATKFQSRNKREFLETYRYRYRKWHIDSRRERRIVSPGLLSLWQSFLLCDWQHAWRVYSMSHHASHIDMLSSFSNFFFCPVLKDNPTSGITILRQMLSWYFCRDEKEPLKEEKKITPIIDSGLRRETSITFDGKRSVSKTGFVGKDSAV